MERLSQLHNFAANVRSELTIAVTINDAPTFLFTLKTKELEFMVLTATELDRGVQSPEGGLGILVLDAWIKNRSIRVPV